MKILFCGCESIQGIKRATGEPYGPFYKLYYLSPAVNVQRETRTVIGHGYGVQEISVSQEVYNQLSQCKPLSHVDMTVEADPTNLNRNIITGVAV